MGERGVCERCGRPGNHAARLYLDCLRPRPRPPADTSWIKMQTINDGPGLAAIYGVAVLCLAAVVVIAILAAG